MADGGEGLLDVLGGPDRTTEVTGPLGSPVTAGWRLSGGTAVVEMARASGLVLAGGPDENRPLDATTTGVGELLRHAVELGARRVIVGMGGSATTDGGLRALEAMGPVARYLGVEILVACDVRTRFTEAAEVFAPQKGATSAQVRLLAGRLERLVQVYLERFGSDVSCLDRAGAAGGLAGGLAAMGARVVISGPPTLIPLDLSRTSHPQGSLGGAAYEPDLDAAMDDADVVMARRLQPDRQTAGMLPSVRE